MSEILRVVHLKKQFGGIVAVDDVSFSIQERKIIGLIGPNGSGKSTLFNIIAGIYPPDSGEVYFKGERITGLPSHEIFKRGIVKSFQIPSLFYTMTVFENFMIPPREQIGEKLINAPFQFRWAANEICKGCHKFIKISKIK
jgi:branched-chain amino acid transport system ATP-binding protein